MNIDEAWGIITKSIKNIVPINASENDKYYFFTARPLKGLIPENAVFTGPQFAIRKSDGKVSPAVIVNSLGCVKEYIFSNGKWALKKR